MGTGNVLPIPNTPLDPRNPQSIAIWNNFYLSLQNIGGANAPANAQYYVATPAVGLTNERNLGALATGFLFITVAAGTATPSSTTSGASLTNLNAANLTGGPLPALDGAALTNLTGANIDGGGTYTPSLTGVANVAASTPAVCQYYRVGDVVTVSGKFSLDPTAGATLTQLGISLPIASNIGAAEEVGGTASTPVAMYTGAIVGDAANNRAELQFTTAADVANREWSFMFSYLVT